MIFKVGNRVRCTVFQYFRNKNIYKNMEKGKKYTLEELDL